MKIARLILAMLMLSTHAYAQADTRRALDALWSARVQMGNHAGFGSMASVDGLTPQLSANESGSVADAPVWCFQGGSGIAPVLLLYADAYERYGDEADWRRAVSLGRTLTAVQLWHGGGWPQDGAIIGGRFESVGVWGSWGNRVHVMPLMRNAATLDDGTSTACGMALLRLHEADVRRAARRGEPEVISTPWLDGARMFADRLVELDGDGVPQVLPRHIATTQTHNQNADTRSPDGIGYMAAAALNDHVSRDALAFLIEAARITGDDRYRQRARRLVLWLCDRTSASLPGWCQQYEWTTGAPRWGRHMEPPAICVGEHGIVSALLRWRADNAADRPIVDPVIIRYLTWLASVEKPAGTTNRVWRYYNASGQPVFASAFVSFVGADKASLAAGGQPYTGEWDAIWLARLRWPQLNLDLAPRYIADAYEGPLPRNAFPAGRLPELLSTRDVCGLWPRWMSINGTQRKVIDVGADIGRIRCLMAGGR